MKLGIEGKLYRLPSGTRATWGAADADGIHGASVATATALALDEVGNVRDLSINLEKSEADVTTRAGNGWRLRKSVLKDGAVEFQMVYDTGDADFVAFMKSWLNGTPIALAVLDGPVDTAGTQGIWSDYEVFNFTKTENLEEGQMVTVSVKPTYSAVPPEWVKVTA